MNLVEIGAKYNTDKNEHGYLPFYQDTLPKNPKRFLEIGCFKGESARMWREHFPPETEVHVLDLFEEHPIPDIPGVIFHKGDATHPYVLSEMRSFNFDIIIDDGSHNSRDQMVTFFGLFNGGHYYIEDIHCCDEEFYRQGLPYQLTVKYLIGGNHYDYISVKESTNIILIKC